MAELCGVIVNSKTSPLIPAGAKETTPAGFEPALTNEIDSIVYGLAPTIRVNRLNHSAKVLSIVSIEMGLGSQEVNVLLRHDRKTP